MIDEMLKFIRNQLCQILDSLDNNIHGNGFIPQIYLLHKGMYPPIIPILWKWKI